MPAFRHAASRQILFRLLALAGIALCGHSLAQQDELPHAILLVAKPELGDPNFRRSVVLVTRAREGQTLGVILNRPTDIELERIAPRGAPLDNYEDAVYFGGPVLPQVAVALLRSESAPPAAFRVADRVYLTMHPDNIAALLANEDAVFRLYAGFSAWGPGQLESEIALGSWYVLPADEDTLLRDDTSDLWEELIDRASARKALMTRASLETGDSGVRGSRN
jgi:putative transcriptional regulator